MGQMGPIKGFGELQDSILKLKENFDAIVLGKFNYQQEVEIPETTPLKKKDFLMTEGAESIMMGCASLREQEQETDEEDSTEMIQGGDRV